MYITHQIVLDFLSVSAAIDLELICKSNRMKFTLFSMSSVLLNLGFVWHNAYSLGRVPATDKNSLFYSTFVEVINS